MNFQFPLLPPTPKGRFKRQDCIPKFFELMRWPDGVCCPQCRSREIIRLRKPARAPKGRYLYNCRKCRRQFTVTTKTALHRTHVPLATWLEAIALAERPGENLTAGDLVRRLNVTHKTALAMCRKLKRQTNDKLLAKLRPPMKMYKNPEEIFRRLFPDLFTN